MFDIQMLNVKMMQMSNIKRFDVPHSNDERQNGLNVKLFDVLHSNVQCLRTNVKPTSDPYLTLSFTTILKATIRWKLQGV